MSEKALNADVFQALRSKDYSLPLRLIENGRLDPNVVIYDPGADERFARFTLLDSAAENGQTETVRRLLAFGANPNIVENGQVPLVSAAALGHSEIIELLLGAGADVNLPAEYSEEKHCTALFKASGTGNIELVRRLLAAGADPKAITHRGLTATHRPIMRQDNEMLKLLIATGATVGRFDLHPPVVRRDLEIVRLLLAARADVRSPFYETFKGSYQIEKGDTPLYLAVKYVSADHVGIDGQNTGVFALEYARPNQQVRLKPYTEWVSREAQLAIIQALIDAGADVNGIRRGTGETPLFVAVKQRDAQVASLLVKAGASPTAKILVGKVEISAMSLAQSIGLPELIRSLEMPR